MSWHEFKALLCGIGPDTVLGRIVSVRMEDDKETLKQFTKEQHRIRNQWRGRIAKQKKEQDVNEFLETMKQAFIHMAGGVNN